MSRVRRGRHDRWKFDVQKVTQAILACFILAGNLILSADALAAKITVVSSRYFSTEGYTRVVFVLNRKTLNFRSGKLKNPPRIFLDIPSGRLRSGFRLPSFENTSLAKKMSVGRPSGKKMRIFIHLVHSQIRHNVFTLSNPHRIVIDLRESILNNRSSPEPRAHSAPKPKVSSSRSGLPGERLQESPGKGDSLNPRREAQSSQKKTPTRKSLNLTERFQKGLGRIVLDPGHGGRDPGTSGKYGLTEKHLVLDISRRIAASLRKRLPPGNKVFLTRTRDKFMSLKKRTSFANEHDADVFVSIHLNSSPGKSTRGIETYLLSEASTPRALEVAARESGTTVARMSDLQKILNDLMLRSKVNESLQLAKKVQASMISKLQKRYGRIKDLGVKRGPFYVLVGASMPSILTEIAFVTNPIEAKRIRTSRYRQTIADGLAEGIGKFVGVPLRRKRFSSRKMEARSSEKATR